MLFIQGFNKPADW